MDRPSTSKSRGICRYYTTSRGCFSGNGCKFLHGANEKLTPYDKAKVCRYYASGHCTRGDQCWFQHALPRVAPDDERIQFNAESCCICLEKPATYGLLTDCSHVFCLECIRQWRSPSGKLPDLVSSGMIKCCPLCRTLSRFVTPSAHFFPSGSARKRETIDAYKSSMARVSCKYFEETSRTGEPCCPFGVDCFYRHTNPDGTPHVFCHDAKHSMNVYRRYHLGGANLPPRFEYDDPIEFLQHIFENPITNLHATLDVIRASLPALMERFASSNEPGSHDLSEDEEIMDNSIYPLDPLEDNLVLHDEAAISLSTAAEGDDLQSTLPSPETRVASQPTTISSGHPLPHQPQPTLIIDISDDEDDEDEDEEESVQRTLVTGCYDSLPESTPIFRSLLEQQPTPLQSIGNHHADMSLHRPQCEHDVDPPFMTDGRGRVVWSSTRNAPGRATSAEVRASRRSRTGSTSRIAYPSTIVSSTRGHAWGGQETQGTDGKVSGEEENGDVD